MLIECEFCRREVDIKDMCKEQTDEPMCKDCHESADYWASVAQDRDQEAWEAQHE